MKNLLLSVVSLLTISASTASAALDYSMPAIEGGFKWNSMDVDGSDSNNQSVGFQFGGSVVVNFNQTLGLKTGIFYSERTFKAETAGNSISGKITYADIPVLFMFKLEDYAGLYIGPTISTKIGDECSGCATGLKSVKSMVVPITLGGQFKFAENFGLNIFFETVSGEMARGINNSRGIGANLLLTF